MLVEPVQDHGAVIGRRGDESERALRLWHEMTAQVEAKSLEQCRSRWTDALRHMKPLLFYVIRRVLARVGRGRFLGGPPDLVGQRPVRQSFRQMHPADFLHAVEVGERPGDAQHTVVAAGRQPHGVGGFAQERHAA